MANFLQKAPTSVISTPKVRVKRDGTRILYGPDGVRLIEQPFLAEAPQAGVRYEPNRSDTPFIGKRNDMIDLIAQAKEKMRVAAEEAKAAKKKRTDDFNSINNRVRGTGLSDLNKLYNELAFKSAN